ncbi:MAG: phosphoenolpyruvate--protein phosphotransferase, partial [Thiotrichales bacterium]|nr:phosphoenolpyruvate--protein phosphotransferase [Thiotrichales bacterium]
RSEPRMKLGRGLPRLPATADIAAFIDTHLLMLDDVALTAEPKRLIKESFCNAEWALKIQRNALVDVFMQMNDPYLSTRRDDIDHVVNRIQRILLKHTPLPHETLDSRLSDCIILADDLMPSDTVLLQHQGVAAFATEFGGPTSHTAILARSLGIPAIVGIHQAMRFVREDDLAVLDGSNGVLLIGPDERTLDYYRKQQIEEDRHYSELTKIKSAPCRTRDDVDIGLQANIELPSDFDTVRNVGAQGVGLYRTEFLYMNRETPPDEEEHYETYCEVMRILDGLPLTIRTVDLGADKQVDGGTQLGPIQSNPALGLRAVRLCLKEPLFFKPQLRAILRASASGPVRLMVPMLSNIYETEQVLQIIRDLKIELREQGQAFDGDIPIGGMIEVPAAAVCADIFASQMDFLSIGTNDLIQYTMAIDRVNDEVSYLYDPLHPAVLRLIHNTLQAGKRHKVPVAMCGEMAGDPEFTRLLLGLGLREFSVHPASLLEVKDIILNCNIAELTSMVGVIMNLDSGPKIQDFINRLN